MRRRRQQGDLSERGQAALEFVFVVLPVFMLVFFAAEAANVVRVWMVLESAAREGARCGAVNPSNPTGSATTTCAVNAAGTLSGFTSSNVTATCPNGCSTGNSVKVAVTYTYSFAPSTDMLGSFLNLIGAGSLASMSLSAQTQMRIEEQTT